MTGTLKVRLEIKGKFVELGKLLCEGANKARFVYNDKYLAQVYAVPISVNLPLQEEPFSYEKTEIYFEGLLPEGFTRRSVAQWLKVNEDDYLEILQGLGAECLGAVQVIDKDYKEASHYEKLSVTEVKKLAKEGVTKTASLMMETHLSLAGASGKTGLYYDGKKWYLPKGLAASTHIVKQSHVRLKHIVANEQLCLLTAKKLGIKTVDSFILNLGEGTEGDILFATKRYDRSVDNTKQIFDGLPCPLRLHQEDFAQALGIDSKNKYEQDNDSYLPKLFSLLRAVSSNPLEDIQELWKRIIFNYIVGNNDGHIKNYSLLYSDDLKSIRLAPAYDIISTTVYEQGSKNLSMAFGSESRIDKVSMDDILQAAQEAGIGKVFAKNMFETMKENFAKALRESALELQQEGFSEVKSLSGKILKTGGIAYWD